jgi:hypothetical protein
MAPHVGYARHMVRWLSFVVALLCVGGCRQERHADISVLCPNDPTTVVERDHASCLRAMGYNDTGVEMHPDGSCRICHPGFIRFVPPRNQ